MTTNYDITEITDETCEKFLELAGEYLDNELSINQKLAFDEHLKSCDECKTFLAEYKQVIDLAQEINLDEPTTELDIGIQNRLRAKLNRELGIDLSYIA